MAPKRNGVVIGALLENRFRKRDAIPLILSGAGAQFGQRKLNPRSRD